MRNLNDLTKRSKDLSEMLDTYRNGDYLSDEELRILNEALAQMSSLASRLGPIFHLAGAYASLTQCSTKMMIDARARRKREESK